MKKRKALKLLTFPILAPLALLFQAGVWLRLRLYRAGVFRAQRFPVGTISVGNLSVGGTGKTPMAEFLIRHLSQQGLRIAYLSRGYGRHTKGYLRVRPGEHTAREVGDEALQVARKFPDVPVVVAERRTEGVQKLLETHEVDCVILDDAFQHWAIHRDVDLVMIDANRLPWNDDLLPLGRLREPVSALRRADIILINKIKDRDLVPKIKKRLKRPAAFARIKPLRLVPFDRSLPIIPIDQLSTRACIGFSALGNNEQFYDQLNDLQLQIFNFYSFGDHHTFTERDLSRIHSAYRRMMAKDIAFRQPPLIITTEKDYARIRANQWFTDRYKDKPFYYLEISLEIIEGEKHLYRALKPVLPQGTANDNPAYESAAV